MLPCLLLFLHEKGLEWGWIVGGIWIALAVLEATSLGRLLKGKSHGIVLRLAGLSLGSPLQQWANWCCDWMLVWFPLWDYEVLLHCLYWAPSFLLWCIESFQHCLVVQLQNLLVLDFPSRTHQNLFRQNLEGVGTKRSLCKNVWKR
jgi:hypothetical protein